MGTKMKSDLTPAPSRIGKGDMAPGMTLLETARALGITRAGVWMSERRAIRKLWRMGLPSRRSNAPDSPPRAGRVAAKPSGEVGSLESGT